MVESYSDILQNIFAILCCNYLFKNHIVVHSVNFKVNELFAVISSNYCVLGRSKVYILIIFGNSNKRFKNVINLQLKRQLMKLIQNISCISEIWHINFFSKLPLNTNNFFYLRKVF